MHYTIQQGLYVETGVLVLGLVASVVYHIARGSGAEVGGMDWHAWRKVDILAAHTGMAVITLHLHDPPPRVARLAVLGAPLVVAALFAVTGISPLLPLLVVGTSLASLRLRSPPLPPLHSHSLSSALVPGIAAALSLALSAYPPLYDLAHSGWHVCAGITTLHLFRARPTRRSTNTVLDV